MDKKEFLIHLRERCYALDNYLRDEVKRREKLKTELQKNSSNLEMYTQEYRLKKENELLDEFKATGQKRVEEFLALIEKLSATLQIRIDEPLDLSNQTLGLTLDVIRMTNINLPDTELLSLLEQFRGCPREIRVLQAAFKSGKMPLAQKWVEDMIFLIPDPVIFTDLCFQVFITKSANIESLARKVNEFTKRAGVSIPLDGKPYRAGNEEIFEAIRRGAGLPVEE